LHKACAGSKHGHLAAVRLLLEGGANVHALNKWRETPLLTAANHGQAGAVEALLVAGADPCKCTDTGWSPLSIAAYKGHDDVVRILLEEGAPTEEDDPTLSALLQAATKGLPDTVELLLRHGADHTVTTKKGDTALSILVEQNLIDAAVEMVTEYNASIPRCSRDRKKVQRARLLINLRMKQLEKEGKEHPDSTDDEETDDDYEGKNFALHIDDDDENESFNSSLGSKEGKRKKKNQIKVSAEEKARAAEEALLLELEQEDAQAKKVEAEASSKRAKKKKKRDRDRQVKLDEERERQLREDKEKLEKEEQDRIRRATEENERKDRELKIQQEKERELRELMEREKAQLAKRKEREDRERREKDPKQYTRSRKNHADRDSIGSVSPATSRSNSTEKRGARVPKGRKVVTDPTPNKKIVSPKARNAKPVAPLAGNRRWETATSRQNKALSPKRIAVSDGMEPSQVEHILEIPDSSSPQLQIDPLFASTNEIPAPSVTSISSLTESHIETNPVDSGIATTFESTNTKSMSNGYHELHSKQKSFANNTNVEHPAIALFRRDKFAELIDRCTSALSGLVNGSSLKRVIYRWIIRAMHTPSPRIDPIIPSWTSIEELVSFFQRQFIGESRRQVDSRGLSLAPNMESLKEAGSSIAIFCLNLAKQVQEYRQQIEAQLPSQWTDGDLGMSASDGTLNGNGSVVTISWANHARVFLPSRTFTTLRDRQSTGSSTTGFLASVFVARIWYDTFRLITKDTTMDFRLSPGTQAVLSAEAAVSAELFSDPFTTWNSNVFWGRFEDIDVLFGGQKAFGKDEYGSEEVLARLGGSVSALLPLDNVVASQYIQRMIDILDGASALNAPVSFIVFLHSDCFHENIGNPSLSDLYLFDSRLAENKRSYVRRVEQLHASHHIFFDGDGAGSSQISVKPSLFLVLQNDSGFSRFGLSNATISKIIRSMTVSHAGNQIPTQGLGRVPDFPISTKQLPSDVMYYVDGRVPISPDPQQSIRSDFSVMGSSLLPVSSFSPANNSGNEILPRGRRGRLFALEDDDGEEDQLGDVDIMMSGMLNNLDVAGLFTDTNVGSENIDIEAISLMGIVPPNHLLNPRNASTGRLG
jgi:Ankyrin repeats (3 copies)/Phosphorylated CTD interacting factor 1 WW domain